MCIVFSFLVPYILIEQTVSRSFAVAFVFERRKNDVSESRMDERAIYVGTFCLRLCMYVSMVMLHTNEGMREGRYARFPGAEFRLIVRQTRFVVNSTRLCFETFD